MASAESEIFRSKIDGNNNNNIHSNNNGENFIEIDDESAIIDDLICDGKRITVYYNTITGNLTWKEIDDGTEGDITFDKIIGVKFNMDGITINYYTIKDGGLSNGNLVSRDIEINKLELKSIDNDKQSQIINMGNTICESINRTGARPKNICVILNPVGGKALGKIQFQKIVVPILEMASVTITEYHETEKSLNGKDIIGDIDIRSFDSILCVGGDGLFSEVVNGILLREDADEACKIPIGIIPTGSQNSLYVSVTGTNNAIWSAICFVTGLRQPLDVLKVLDTETGMIRYSITMVSFGILGDITSDCQSKRWLGPLRYQFSAIKKWISMRHYKVVVSIIPETKDSTSAIDISVDDPRWHVLHGDSLFMFCCFNVSGANSQMPAQVVSLPDDGLMSLLIWKESSRSRVLEYMWKMKNGKHYDLKYLVFTKAKAVKIEPIVGSNVNSTVCPINIDGEVIQPSKILVNILPQKITLLLGRF